MLRRFAGEDSRVERLVRRQVVGLKALRDRKYVGPNFVEFWSGSRRARTVGIYVKGSCDLMSVFACQPLIQKRLSGTCIIQREGAIWDSSSSLILQPWQRVPAESLATVTEKMKLPATYFAQGRLFDRTMTVESLGGPMQVDKQVVVMSIGADIIRSLYRHREHGYLIDPGGWWFNQDMSRVLSDLKTAKWFRDTFESVGKIAVEDFTRNVGEIVTRLQAVGATVLIYNVLTVEPGSRDHNYRFVKNAIVKRAREFDLALVDLARRLDFSIVDVDRTLKRRGVGAQVDYAHFPPELYGAIGQETYRVMCERGVF